jgi:Flp pilus assembly secretin CpaC
MLERVDDLLDAVRAIQQLLELRLPPAPPTNMQVQFKGENGMPSEKGTVVDHLTISANNIETDAAGNDVTLTEDPAQLQWTIDNPAIATLVANPDGTVTITGNSPGTAIVTCTDTSRTPPLSGTGEVTVTPAPPGAPVKLSVSFSA